MTESSPNRLLTCPDCGGILEPSRPAWAATIEFVTAAQPHEAAPDHWRCLICGYQEETIAPAQDPDHQRSAPIA